MALPSERAAPIVSTLVEVGAFPWLVLPDRVVFTDREIEAIRSLAAKGDATIVFNPDRRRIQVKLPTDHAICRRVLETARKLCEGRSAFDAVILRSCAGCARQQWHCDYDPSEVANARVKPLGILAALEPSGARLHLLYAQTEYTIDLEEGQILAFDGDVVHSGSDYDQENVRIHIYLDSAEVKRPRNKTYLL
jgi:hypothetical protein